MMEAPRPQVLVGLLILGIFIWIKIVEAACPDGKRACDTGNQCFPASYWCDGEADCNDNSDESVENCPGPGECGEGHDPCPPWNACNVHLDYPSCVKINDCSDHDGQGCDAKEVCCGGGPGSCVCPSPKVKDKHGQCRGNEDIYNISDEFEIWPDRTKDCGVICPWASGKIPIDLLWEKSCKHSSSVIFDLINLILADCDCPWNELCTAPHGHCVCGEHQVREHHGGHGGPCVDCDPDLSCPECGPERICHINQGNKSSSCECLPGSVEKDGECVWCHGCPRDCGPDHVCITPGFAEPYCGCPSGTDEIDGKCVPCPRCPDCTDGKVCVVEGSETHCECPSGTKPHGHGCIALPHPVFHRRGGSRYEKDGPHRYGHGHGHDHYDSGHYGNAEYGSGHHGSDGYGSGHHGSDEYGSGHHGRGYHGNGHHGSGYHGSDEYGSGHDGSGYNGNGHDGSGHHGSDEYGSGRHGSGHHGSDEYGSGHHGSGYHGYGQYEDGYHGSGDYKGVPHRHHGHDHYGDGHYDSSNYGKADYGSGQYEGGPHESGDYEGSPYGSGHYGNGPHGHGPHGSDPHGSGPYGSGYHGSSKYRVRPHGKSFHHGSGSHGKGHHHGSFRTGGHYHASGDNGLLMDFIK